MRIQVPKAQQKQASKGFALLEVLLAVSLFGLVVLSISACLTEAISTSSWIQFETLVRQNLESRLADVRTKPLTPGEESETDELGVTYTREIKQLDFENHKKEKLLGLYSVSITARWKIGKEDQEELAEIYVYQP
jgi:prepilin-type N-terminal cleavage/methylation domain-containing protein